METDGGVEKQRTFFHTPLQNPAGFRTAPTGSTAVQIHKQQNRTFHLLQKPDIFTCYRHHDGRSWMERLTSARRTAELMPRLRGSC